MRSARLSERVRIAKELSRIKPLVALALLACHASAAGEAPSVAASSGPPDAVAAAPATSASSAPAPVDCDPVRLDLPDPPAVRGLAPPTVDIDDPRAALSHFFERTALLARQRANATVRIAVYGDSNGTMDYMTGEMRRVLQTSHGDAGHGFVALARPWPWYRHQYVVADYDHDAWSAFTVTTHPTPALDPWYGPGLIVAQSKQTGATTWVATAPDGAPIGTRASHFEVWYLAWPPGGAFDVKMDGDVVAGADTRSDGEPRFAFVEADVADGAHKMTIVTRSAKPVRLLGAVVERGDAGFQVDGLGVGSLNCLCVLRESEELDAQIFAHRPYDLVVFHIGSNTWNPAVMDPVACMKEEIARLRRAMPDVSILIMTPPDWGEGGTKWTPGWMRKAEEQLRRVADEAPAAFFDFRRAMGGEGSMARFEDRGMTQGDGIHFNQKGGAYVGQRVVDALGRAFAAWAHDRPRAGCE
ncbi:MAG: GDSL-type esterase/lipase family protein [Polyangiaceae bacterium]